MRLRQKFMTLAWLMGMAVAVVCIISYHFASEELQQSTDSELSMTVARETTLLEGWLEEKKKFGETASNVLTSLNGNQALLKDREILSAVTADKDLLEMSLGL